MKRLLALALTLAAVTAGGARADGVGPSPGAETGWDGVLAPGGTTRYVALPGQRETIVAAVRVRDGRIARWGAVDGGFGIPLVALDGSTDGLSGDGKRLVLAAPTWNPGPVSRFPILATSNFRVLNTVALRGAWAFDAISADASTLFLIQYLGSSTSANASYQPYRVRAFDVAAAKLVPGAIVDRREEEALMRGQPATRTWSTDHRWAYTLYARQSQPPFVHALDTERREAFCIDLPLRLNQSKQMALRLRLRADGSLAVVSGRRTLAAVDTKTFALRQS
jgi:hypothetical protein